MVSQHQQGHSAPICIRISHMLVGILPAALPYFARRMSVTLAAAKEKGTVLSGEEVNTGVITIKSDGLAAWGGAWPSLCMNYSFFWQFFIIFILVPESGILLLDVHYKKSALLYTLPSVWSQRVFRIMLFRFLIGCWLDISDTFRAAFPTSSKWLWDWWLHSRKRMSGRGLCVCLVLPTPAW